MWAVISTATVPLMTWFRDGLRRIGRVLAPQIPSPSPGTKSWLMMVEWDLDQGQRNAKDLEEVLIRRRRRVRRADGEDGRWAENLALARIEVLTGMRVEGTSRVHQLLQTGRIPRCAEAVLPDFLADIAASVGGEEGRALLDRGLALADARERRRVSQALLTRMATFERARNDLEAEHAVLLEGLGRLGLGRAEDPYRSGAQRRGELEDWEREAVLWTGQRLLVHASRNRAFEAADQLLVDLRAVLEGQPKLSPWNADLLRHEGWLAYLRGDFVRARDAWTALQDLHGDTQDAEHWVVDHLNLGFAHLRLGSFEVARRLARAIIDVGDQGDTAPLHRAHALAAEAALGEGDHDGAKAHATLALPAADGVLRSAARRVLAELHLRAGEHADALELAERAVFEFDAAAEESAFIIDRLLTLARAAAPSDPDLAAHTLRRAASIDLAPTHPFHREIERARTELRPLNQ